MRHGPSDAARLRNFDEIIDKVETLLVGDAGLAKSMAGTLLYNELSRRGRFGDLPIPTKIAFRLWLARLLDTVPQSEVLHAATKIRNGLVHGSETGSDWPLISKD